MVKRELDSSLVEQILARHFPAQPWQITLPETGRQKESYIIQGRQRKLFLKLDTAAPAGERLAALGAAPPLLARGSYAGRPYIIQAFVEGSPPDRNWLVRHLAQVALFFRRVHGDRRLAALLAPAGPPSPAAQVAQEVAVLAEAAVTASPSLFATEAFHSAFARFARQASRLQPAPFVPVHPDPSPANMLVSGQKLIMLDWDGLLLSAPGRDVGLLAWWYLPQERWPAFFGRYGRPVARESIFWWTARRSLEVALWFDARGAGPSARAFLADFYRAVQHEANPQVAA